jgi:serine/threonine-protein kinase RsbW
MTAPPGNIWAVPELELEFPPRPEFVRTARLAAAALARVDGVPDDIVEEIKLAVSEACTNAVTPPEDVDGTGAGEDPEPVRLTATSDGDRIVIDVFDRRGTAFREVTGTPSEIDTEDLPFERALSLPLVRGLVDELTVTPREGGGLRLQMVVGFERQDG